MKPHLIIPILMTLAACGPKYIYKQNGVPIISCRDLDNSDAPYPAMSECLNRNVPLLHEIYSYELKNNETLEESMIFTICTAPDGSAKARSEQAAPSQLEKFVKSYIELMEFPKFSDEHCFEVPFAFKKQPDKA